MRALLLRLPLRRLLRSIVSLLLLPLPVTFAFVTPTTTIITSPFASSSNKPVRYSTPSILQTPAIHPSFLVVVATTRLSTTTTTRTRLLVMSSTYMETMQAAASKALGRPVQLEAASGGGFSGGGGASTSAVVDKETGTKYFVKSATNKGQMLKAEYWGVKAMADTQTIQVPTPVAYGEYDNKAFVLLEYLDFCGGGSQFELGVQLAKMHRCFSETGLFGFEVDNTIGATHQPNLPWIEDWADFWDVHRLGHMLKLTGNAGLSSQQVEELRQKTRQLLSHQPAPSLLHGDLWGGNKGFCKTKDGKTVPVIFDPATYYGDREADVAMTYLFGGFNNDFYKGYESEWPLPEGHEQRRVVYNLYHILNHYVLFGGGYLSQAKGMIQNILRM